MNSHTQHIGSFILTNRGCKDTTEIFLLEYVDCIFWNLKWDKKDKRVAFLGRERVEYFNNQVGDMGSMRVRSGGNYIQITSTRLRLRNGISRRILINNGYLTKWCI